ncbi:hypothetical protein [Vibrio anguillarum]|uniref:hypothetical protein n=1 Tax=Vibrio anguillarum TaxID=55601 RepID=UPI0030BA1C1E
MAGSIWLHPWAFTGTTPANATQPQAESISFLFLSEISHQFANDSYCFGGGYYRRGQLENARVYSCDSCIRLSIARYDTVSIDYHLRLPGLHPIGSPVVMAYRTQVFVTRSDVALVQGFSTH